MKETFSPFFARVWRITIADTSIEIPSRMAMTPSAHAIPMSEVKGEMISNKPIITCATPLVITGQPTPATAVTLPAPILPIPETRATIPKIKARTTLKVSGLIAAAMPTIMPTTEKKTPRPQSGEISFVETDNAPSAREPTIIPTAQIIVTTLTVLSGHATATIQIRRAKTPTISHVRHKSRAAFSMNSISSPSYGGRCGTKVPNSLLPAYRSVFLLSSNILRHFFFLFMGRV